ncbi:hypothetical protein OA005_00510 [Paracoccaceae bacterium]|nr:hypothetical protein [Paracoccaceae bacterium]
MNYALRAPEKYWVLRISSLDLFLSYILFFPPIVHSMGQSYSLGIVICSITLIPFYAKFILNGFAKVNTFLLALFLLSYSLLTWFLSKSINSSTDLTNWTLGLLAIMSLMILASIFSYIYGRELITNKLHSNRFPFFSILALYSHLMLFLRFAEISPFYSQLHHRVSLFSEPSHICYVTAIFLFIRFLSASRSTFFIYFLMATMFAYLCGSLIGVATLLCVAFALAKRYLKIVVFLIFVALALSVNFINFKPAEKLVLTGDDINLSSMVYLAGWERAYSGLLESNFIGLGVNQFGVYGDQGEYSKKIMAAAGLHINKFDGSFIFAKLTGEFGIFSLFITIYLVTIWFNCYVRNRYNGNPLTLGILSAFFILFFFRSPGYICGASAMVIALLTNPQLMKHRLPFKPNTTKVKVF